MPKNDDRGEAFVVWLDPARPAGCQGHVERMATSERVRFDSADELIAVITGAAQAAVAVGRVARGPAVPGKERRE